MPIGKSIRIYLADSTVTGIRYAELVNWTGQAIACPRSRLGELSSWLEASKPGVYLLFEARLGDSKPLAYIGESENVTERLTSHDRQKEFWNEVVIFTSKDENLTKAHVKFLEFTLVHRARKADRYALENGNTPPESGLPRPDKDAMAEFVENIRMVLGTLGYPILEPLLKPTTFAPSVGKRSADNTPAKSKTELELTFRVNTLTAAGILTDEGFVLKRGSQLSRLNTDSAARKVVKIKQLLQADDKLVAEGDHLLLNEDVLVSSSSYAAVMVAGTSRSGPQSWIAADGRSLKEIEDAAVQDAPN
jgi:Domain of unknown function (DUF4357)